MTDLSWTVAKRPSTYRDFVARVCADGEIEVNIAYTDEIKIKGALDGFAEAYQTVGPQDLKGLLASANAEAEDAMRSDAAPHGPDGYWYWRVRAAQIGWVANVVSAWMQANGREGVIQPTVQGANKMHAIVGLS